MERIEFGTLCTISDNVEGCYDLLENLCNLKGRRKDIVKPIGVASSYDISKDGNIYFVRSKIRLYFIQGEKIDVTSKPYIVEIESYCREVTNAYLSGCRIASVIKVNGEYIGVVSGFNDISAVSLSAKDLLNDELFLKCTLVSHISKIKNKKIYASEFYCLNIRTDKFILLDTLNEVFDCRGDALSIFQFYDLSHVLNDVGEIKKFEYDSDTFSKENRIGRGMTNPEVILPDEKFTPDTKMKVIKQTLSFFDEFRKQQEVIDYKESFTFDNVKKEYVEGLTLDSFIKNGIAGIKYCKFSSSDIIKIMYYYLYDSLRTRWCYRR